MRLTILAGKRRALVEDPEPVTLTPLAMSLLLRLAADTGQPVPDRDLLRALGDGYTHADLRRTVRELAHALPHAIHPDPDGYTLRVHPDDLLVLP